MHDYARPHVARVVTDYLAEVRINAMDWPARSPDFNPIEHVWDMLGRRVRQRCDEIDTLNDLRRVLQEEWDNLPQADIQHLLEGLPRRLQAGLRARGGNTRY